MKSRRTPPVPKWLSVLLPLVLLLTARPLSADSLQLPGEKSLYYIYWDFVVTKEWSAQIASRHIESELTKEKGVESPQLKLSNPTDAPVHVPVYTIESPLIKKDGYVVRAQIRYENMGSVGGYLEMWSVFPPTASGEPERRFFSRTLGESPGDPMAKFVANSDWRPVALPFNATGAGANPIRLEISALIPAHGTVWIGPLEIVVYGRSTLPEPSGRMGSGQPAFFPVQRVTASGGLLLAAALGLLSWLAHRRQASAFVLPAAWGIAMLGWAGWIGTIYLLDRSPETWAPQWRAASLLAAATAGVFTISALYFGSRYRQAEWQRMAAIDASV